MENNPVQGVTKKYMSRAYNRKKIYSYQLVLRKIFYSFLKHLDLDKFYVKLRKII